jgi:uncharacterized protein YutE (UPF0331/DUF86 family)
VPTSLAVASVPPPRESSYRDIAGELASRRGDRFEDYTDAIRSLSRDSRFPTELVRSLEPVPGFRNIVIHEYVALDLDRVVVALRSQEPMRQFIEIVRHIESP